MSNFRGYTKPEGATAAGYAWLIARYALRVPVPPIRAAIAGQHRPIERDGWSIKPEQYAPDETVAGQLSFADAARQYSTCPSAARGGDLGSFKPGMMVPQFDEV